MYEISKKLWRQGDEFVYSSFEEGLDYLRSQGMHPLQSPSIDLKWSSEGGFSSRDSFVGFPRAILTFIKQFGFESDMLSRFKPRLVISDSRVSPIFAGRAQSIPVVTLLNQFKVLFPSRFRGKALSNSYERVAGNLLGLFWSLSEKVLMSDLPPPYTISEANINGTDVSNIIQYVGFTSPKLQVTEQSTQKVKRLLGLESRKLVFIHISGPNATKKRFAECALIVAEKLSKQFDVVVSLGYPNGSSEPKKIAGGSWLYEWCPVKDELFVLSDAIVGRAGHGTIGQCINLGTPAVLVPIFNHSEQLANAEKYQKLGLGLELRSESLTADHLEETVDLLLREASYRERSHKIMEISKRYDGVDGVVRIAESYL